MQRKLPLSAMSSDRLLIRLSGADDALSRLDERVRACGYRSGYIARRDLAEAVAWSWTQGAVTSLEDLVLHDQGMDVRAPNQGLQAAHALVLVRRKASIGGTGLLSIEGAGWLSGRRRNPPVGGSVTRRPPLPADDPDAPGIVEQLAGQPTALELGDSAGVDGGIQEWFAFMDGLPAAAPAVLRATALVEAWWVIDPLPRQRYLGGVLAGLWLTGQRRVTSHVVGLEVGLRTLPRRGAEFRGGDVVRRLGFWLAVIAQSAEDGLQELKRLELARQVMAQQAAGRRAHARVADVMELLLELPVVTAPLIAQRLGITQQSARRSLEDLGSVVIEISGRSRFRAWRL